MYHRSHESGWLVDVVLYGLSLKRCGRLGIMGNRGRQEATRYRIKAPLVALVAYCVDII